MRADADCLESIAADAGTDTSAAAMLLYMRRPMKANTRPMAIAPKTAGYRSNIGANDEARRRPERVVDPLK